MAELPPELQAQEVGKDGTWREAYEAMKKDYMLLREQYTALEREAGDLRLGVNNRDREIKQLERLNKGIAEQRDRMHASEQAGKQVIDVLKGIIMDVMRRED